MKRLNHKAAKTQYYIVPVHEGVQMYNTEAHGQDSNKSYTRALVETKPITYLLTGALANAAGRLLMPLIGYLSLQNIPLQFVILETCHFVRVR